MDNLPWTPSESAGSTSHVDHQGIEIEDRVTSEIVRNVGVCNVVNSCYIFNCK
ncbi:hypothetical protein HanXRQr2_Chr16g0749131 [Helianthus annuus]|uniref:Uncharacterized protein n=1 Tax=Helianthus annuus TaxID=4232 RepID=A0A9K3DS63_HELAN|nr:hypothetical protein HanXRQr2_Chr16g0749131 [Helianthus annuus]KAJ0821274.1 hypothetical protein HanPSC8_Chr16g0718131 [Helianthus annuus]